MKRILAVIMTVLVCLSVAGCGTDSHSRSTSVPVTETTPPVEEMETAVPQLQEITAYLEDRQPYYRGTTTVNDEYRFKIMNYNLALGEERLIEQYIACLIACYDVSLGDIYSSSHGNVEYTYYYLTFDGDKEQVFGHSDMDHQVSVSVATYPDTAQAEVTISYAEGFEFVDDGHRSDYSTVVLVPTPTPTPTPTPAPAATPAPQPAQPVQTVDRNAAPIPEFSVFLNRWPSEDKDRYHGGNRKYYQKIPLDTQQTVVAEVLALLDTDRYQLELIEKVETDNRTDYNYRYTGNVAMDSIHSKSDDTRYYNL